VGPKTQKKLAGEGIALIGDLASLGEPRLREIFGDRGPELAARARGSDDSPVVAEREPRSMSNETTFARDVSDEGRLRQTLRSLSDEVGRRLRDEGLAGWTVRIKLRWPDFKTLTRQTRLAQPTDQDGEIYRAALDLFENAWSRGRAVRLLGVGVSELGPKLRQLSLFERSWEHDEKLLEAIDSIREKYGPEAVRRAGSLRHRRPPRQAGTSEQDRSDPDKPVPRGG
jgi:DNA polymerase-4